MDCPHCNLPLETAEECDLINCPCYIPPVEFFHIYGNIVYLDAWDLVPKFQEDSVMFNGEGGA